MEQKHAQTLEKLGYPRTLQHLIDGELVDGSERTLDAIDPTTQQKIADIPVATAAQIDKAVAASRRAQREWRALAPHKRRRVMDALAERLKADPKLFPQLEALECGMPKGVSKQFSSPALVRNIKYYGEWADKLYGDVISAAGPTEAMNLTVLEPVGVVAAIIPWNTPCLFLGSKTGPALAAGCSIIIKPSELASLPAFAFAQAALEAGVPAGLIQVLFGDGEVGSALCGHPGVDKIAFTGGTATGRRIMEQAAGSTKRVLLEMGGKSPNIIFEDADIQRASMMSCLGMFSLSGQACAAGSRLFVHKDVKDAFLDGLISFANTTPMGDPLSGGSMLGPLISRAHLERVEGYVEAAKQAGAKVLAGGKRPDLGPGNFYEPTVLTGVDPDSPVAREEIFGPVMCLFEFEKEDEVLARANDTDFGLAAGIWTQDISRALRVARLIDAGTVWINSYGNLPVQVPFGGLKQSGFGRDGGREGIREYLETKHISVQL